MAKRESGEGGDKRFSDDEDDIFQQDKKLIDAWHEILKKFFLPKPANDND
jgi:hypothetical protein